MTSPLALGKCPAQRGEPGSSPVTRHPPKCLWPRAVHRQALTTLEERPVLRCGFRALRSPRSIPRSGSCNPTRLPWVSQQCPRARGRARPGCCEPSFLGTQPHLPTCATGLSGVGASDAVGSTKPRILTPWPFAEAGSQPRVLRQARRAFCSLPTGERST